MTMIEARGPIKGAVASCFLLLSSCIILGCGSPSCFHLLSSWITLGKTKIAALLLGVVLLISQVNVHNGNVDITLKFWCIFCLLALTVTIRLREKNSVVETNRKNNVVFSFGLTLKGCSPGVALT